MPQKNRTVKSVLGGLLGLVGLSAVAGVLVTAAVTPAIAVTGVAGSQAVSLFDNLPNSLTPGAPMEPTTIYGTGEDGKPFQLAKFFDQNRVPVEFDQVSPTMYDAILSSEDKNFYSHGGVNLGATVKALIDNLRHTSSRGASTISQQFVKNVLIQECEKGVSATEDDYQDKLTACWTEATEAKGSEGIERKLQEMRYAVQIEKDYSKNDILLGYLNIANFGGQTYGIEAAANYYFGTTAKKVSLNQAATLAGIVQNPNTYRIDREGGSWTDKDGNAHNSKEDGYATTKDRRDYVLDRMLVNGQITKEQHDEAVAAPIEPSIHPSDQDCGASGGNAYFCQYVKSVIEEDEAFGDTPEKRLENLRRGGMDIYTSLDMRVQGPAIEAVHARVPATMEGILVGGAGVSIEATTGRILAIAQNTTFKESADASLAKGESAQIFAADREHGGGDGFETGSTYKLFTLLEWLDKGNSINQVLDARLRTFTPFTRCGETFTNNDEIGNFGLGRGSVSTVARFTATSLNTGFLAMAQKLDLCDINKMAKRLGVHYGNGKDVTVDGDAPNDPFPTVLGSKNIAPIQMAGAYATVANAGKYCEPRVIDRIVTQDGKEIDPPKTNCTQVISPEVAATASFALRGVMQGGTGSGANPWDGVPVIGKTGTAEASHTMLVESSTKVTTAVWIGNVDGRKALKDFWANGYSLNNIRYPLARDIQHAANVAYGGDRFPDPDPKLTRNVLKWLPDVTGRSIDDATQVLRNAGFSVQVGEEIDSSRDKGIVAEQNPGSGRVSWGTTVTLRPSSGTAPTPVPDVTGADFEKAKKALEKAGFTVEGGECAGDAKVSSQDPAGSSEARAGSTVTLTCESDD